MWYFTLTWQPMKVETDSDTCSVCTGDTHCINTHTHKLRCVCQCDRQSNTQPDASQLPSNLLFTSMVMLLKAATKKMVKKGMMGLKMKVLKSQQKGFSRLSITWPVHSYNTDTYTSMLPLNKEENMHFSCLLVAAYSLTVVMTLSHVYHIFSPHVLLSITLAFPFSPLIQAATVPYFEHGNTQVVPLHRGCGQMKEEKLKKDWWI